MHRLCILVTCIALASAPLADDAVRVHPLPQLDGADWRFGSEGIAVSEKRVAISPRQNGRPAPDSSTRIMRSMIVQYGDGAPQPRSYASKALALGYAADGETLLVSQIVPPEGGGCENCPVRYLILAPDGEEVWRSEPRRGMPFRFVPDRTAIYRAGACGYTSCRGDELELRDMRGRLLARVEPGERFQCAVALGDGEDFVLFYRDSIERVGIVGGVTHRWEVAHETPVRGVRSQLLQSGEIAFRAGSELRVLDTESGSLRSWSPEQLAALDDLRSADDYRLVGIKPGPATSTLLIHNTPASVCSTWPR